MTALLPWLHMVLCTCMSEAPRHYCHCAAASGSPPDCSPLVATVPRPLSVLYQAHVPRSSHRLAAERLKGSAEDGPGPSWWTRTEVRLPQVSLRAQGSQLPHLRAETPWRALAWAPPSTSTWLTTAWRLCPSQGPAGLRPGRQAPLNSDLCNGKLLSSPLCRHC